MVAPTWHPGGEWLACGHSEIYLLNTKTHAFINATRSPHLDMQSSWSPDGKSIVFGVNLRNVQRGATKVGGRKYSTKHTWRFPPAPTEMRAAIPVFFTNYFRISA